MDFRLFGKMPSSNDMLHIFAIVSAKSGSSCLMSHVGAGSSEQCFEGEAPIILEISSADTGLIPDRVEICLGSITGGMAPDVARRILSILVWKKSANSSAENVLSDVVFGGLRRTPIFTKVLMDLSGLMIMFWTSVRHIVHAKHIVGTLIVNARL